MKSCTPSKVSQSIRARDHHQDSAGISSLAGLASCTAPCILLQVKSSKLQSPAPSSRHLVQLSSFLLPFRLAHPHLTSFIHSPFPAPSAPPSPLLPCCKPSYVLQRPQTASTKTRPSSAEPCRSAKSSQRARPDRAGGLVPPALCCTGLRCGCAVACMMRCVMQAMR